MGVPQQLEELHRFPGVQKVRVEFSALFVNGKLSKGSSSKPSEIILGNFYRHLATFYWSHCLALKEINQNVYILFIKLK